MSRAPKKVFRSLADVLRSWPDEQVAALLVDRLDLATPAPHDFGQLASRACARSSVKLAIASLNLNELFVLNALVLVGQTTHAQVADIVHAPKPVVDTALERILALGLAWDSPDGLKAVRTVGEEHVGGMGVGVSGLQTFSSTPGSPEEIAASLEAISDRATTMLAHVEANGGQATSDRARLTVTPAQAQNPVEELIAHRLLTPRSGGLVVPGEVGLQLRGGHTTTEPLPVSPELATKKRSAALVESGAVGAADEFCRHIALLGAWLDQHQPASLQTGGLAVRDFRALCQALGTGEETAALAVEVANAAGLIAARASVSGLRSVWVPTDRFDAWARASTGTRWARVAQAWLSMPRDAARVGTRDDSGRRLNALGDEVVDHTLPTTRRSVLAVLAEIEPGNSLDTGTGTASLAARLEWSAPRNARRVQPAVSGVLAEAATLGLTGLNAPAPWLAALLADTSVTELATALDERLAAPVEHVVIQADLTAVAPGPLVPDVARRLELLADVESRGQATTFRFTSASLRRSFDEGWSAEEVHTFLTDLSSTPLPQALTYLVDDTMRTYGRTRVGYAEAFIRSDDESALAELMALADGEGFSLRRIAPTVVISMTPFEDLLPRLREIGLAPVVEAIDGTPVISRAQPLRARAPKAAVSPDPADRARAAVVALRAGERAGSGGGAGHLTPTAAMAALREAIETGSVVSIGYTGPDGTVANRVVEPISVEGGTLRAFDQRAQATRGFAIHRVTEVAKAAG